MKKVQIFISYCGDDTHIMHDLRDNYLAKLKGEYALKGAEIVIREMETECVDKWDVWMVGAVKSCDILVCILTDNVLYPKEKTEKRVLEELCVARNNDLNIIPIVFSSRGLPDEYFAHIGRISQIWYGVGDTQEQKFTVVKDKATLLIDGILSGNKVKQYESLKIKSGYQFSKFDGFVGRKEEMEKISSSFDQSNLLILKGEGGIGKTSLAKAYFNASDSYENGYIVDASSGITQTIQNFPFEDTLNEPNAEERYAGNLKRLKELSEKIIIILDNYDVEGENDSDTLAQLENMACKYIITSRIGTTRSYNTIELGRMPDEDLIKLVYNIHSKIERDNKMSKEEVEKLLVEFFANVNGLTIAVELASAIMRDGDVSLVDINKAILSCNDKVTTGRHAGQKASAFDHLASLYSYAKLSKEEHEVLKVLTHISPAVGIERKKLKEYLQLDSNDVINDLIRKSFIRMDEDKVLSMHPLMSDVYYKQEKVADQEGIMKILDYVSDFNFSTDKTLTLTEASLKNITTYKYLVEKREASFKKENLRLKAILYEAIGFEYNKIADFRQALEYNLKALGIRKILYADKPNHPALASSYNNIGSAYGKLGDYQKALEYLLKALEIRKIAYADNPNHPDLAESYNNVGLAYGDLGDHQKALEYLLKALGIWEIVYADNPDHSNLALSYNNVGVAYGDLGDHPKALEYYLKALEIRKIVYADNPNHPDLAQSYNNVGLAYGKLGDYQLALEYYLKALGIRKIVYADNPNHLDLAQSYNNIGSAYGDLGDNQKALEYQLKALEISKILYADNPNHPDFAISYSNMGYIYRALGDYQKALEYSLKALGIRKIVYADNPDHPDLASSYNNVGLAYGKLGDHPKALEYQLKALEIRKIVYADNPNHPDLASSYNNVGLAYGKLGDYQKALEYSLKALKIYEIAYADNPNHPNLATSYNNVGMAYWDLGNYQKALEYYLKELGIRKIVYADNPNHPDLAWIYNNIGSAYGNLGDNQKALEYLSKALEIRKIAYADNPNHPNLAVCYNNIGSAYGDLGDHPKALEYRLKALEIRKIVYAYNTNHPAMALIYSNIGATYKEMGKCEEALEYLLKALEIRKTLYKDKPYDEVMIKNITRIAECYEALGNGEKAKEYYSLIKK